MGEETKPSHQVDKNDQEPDSLNQQTIEDIKEAKLDNDGGSNSENRSADARREAEAEIKQTGELQDMEEEIRRSQQLELDGQEPNNIGQITMENKENPILEQEQHIEGTKEIRLENEEKSNTENQRAEVGKAQETEKKHAGILKKPKVVSKQKHLLTPTIPQPFSLASAKRTTRERQGGSLQTTESKSKLSKSVSLNLKVDTQNLNGAKQSSELRRGASVTSRSTLTRIGITEKQTEIITKIKEKVQAKNIGSKVTQENVKDKEETKLNKLKKSTTFKASPLPSFYHRKDPPPKPELKKVPVTRPKSPKLGQRSKSLAEGRHITKEDINKSASRTISNTAKETIHKLLKGAWKGPSPQQKKVLKSSTSISRGSRIQMETV